MGVLNVALSLRGVHVLLRIFSGVRVLRPLAENFRDPSLWVFLTPSLNLNYIMDILVV